MKTSNGTKPFNKTTIFLSISLLFAVMVGGLYASFFVVMKDKNRSIAEFLSRSEELIGRESRLRFAKSTLKIEQSNVDRLSSYLIRESEVVSFAKKIEALGAESGTALSLDLLESGVIEGGYPLLNFRVKAKGGFKEVMKLTSLLENYPIKFEWRSVHLVRDDSEMALPAVQNPKTSVRVSPQWIITISLLASNFLRE